MSEVWRSSEMRLNSVRRLTSEQYNLVSNSVGLKGLNGAGRLPGWVVIAASHESGWLSQHRLAVGGRVRRATYDGLPRCVESRYQR